MERSRAAVTLKPCPFHSPAISLTHTRQHIIAAQGSPQQGFLGAEVKITALPVEGNVENQLNY